MLPVFVFLALPTLSLALVCSILWRRLHTPALRVYSHGPMQRAMSRLEALQTLGLDDDTDNNAVRSAYTRLMIRYHPDHGGSHQTAARLNLARDTLLKKRRDRAA